MKTDKQQLDEINDLAEVFIKHLKDAVNACMRDSIGKHATGTVVAASMRAFGVVISALLRALANKEHYTIAAMTSIAVLFEDLHDHIRADAEDIRKEKYDA